MSSNYLAFKDAQEFVSLLRILNAQSLANRHNLDKLTGFTSLLNLFEQLSQLKDESKVRETLAHLKPLVAITEGRNTKASLVTFKFTPLYACIASPEGLVKIGDVLYNLCDEDDVRSLSGLEPALHVQEYVDSDGYDYSELPPEDLTQHLPCFPALQWPEYPTNYFDTRIDGRDVVVQLWKGLCPQYIPGMPGGIGAEVGVYWRGFIPNIWWPDYGNKRVIEFTLVNPNTNAIFFSAGPETVWWRHKWMTWPSYLRYVSDQQNNVPSFSGYRLEYTISGIASTWE